MSGLRVDIWSDLACPWCYIGKRHLEQALARFARRDEVEIVWRSFELDPAAPRVSEPNRSYVDRIARKYGTAVPQAQVMIDRMVGTAATDGVELRFDRIRPGNTFDAHRLLHFARDHGLQDALKERLLRAYLTEGQAIGDLEVLAALAREVGLDETAARELLAGDRYTAEVRHDEARARELGIGGVPCFVIAGRVGISGAQPADVLLDALERVASELDAATNQSAAAACGPAGCD